jgi:hypothetical protein
MLTARSTFLELQRIRILYTSRFKGTTRQKLKMTAYYRRKGKFSKFEKTVLPRVTIWLFAVIHGVELSKFWINNSMNIWLLKSLQGLSVGTRRSKFDEKSKGKIMLDWPFKISSIKEWGLKSCSVGSLSLNNGGGKWNTFETFSQWRQVTFLQRLA